LECPNHQDSLRKICDKKLTSAMAAGESATMRRLQQACPNKLALDGIGNLMIKPAFAARMFGR
jgi:hypothetical protein